MGNITTAFVKQFGENVKLLSQQRGTKLSDCVENEMVIGEEWFTDQIGSVSPVPVKDRHSDSPILSTPHMRRRGTIEDFVWGDMIDKEDKVRMLIDPESKYVLNASYGMGRTKDDVIISAFDGVAYTGKKGTTPKALPSSQKIDTDFVASGTHTGLTYEKILNARTIIEDNDVDTDDPMNELFLLCSPLDIQNLLKQTEIKSADYNTVKALAQGTIDQYMGFTFKKLSSKRILKSSDGLDRRCIAWAKSGMAMGVANEVEANVSKRADKNYNWYAHLKMTVGAVRLEEEKVVQVNCRA